MDNATKASFEEKVQAIMAQGHSRDSAERIAGAMVQDEKAVKRFKILKADNERRLVTAVTNVVTEKDGTPVVDHDGDVIKIDNLEDAFIDAFGSGGADKSGSMHERDGGADIAMHFTLSRSEWESLEEYIGKEIGIVKIKIHDDALWADVKAGKTLEVSIEGDGYRTPV